MPIEDGSGSVCRWKFSDEKGDIKVKVGEGNGCFSQMQLILFGLSIFSSFADMLK